MGGLKNGESILIHNAGGGVGLAALDISMHLGATTYGTSSSKKHSFLKERGLNHPIDYRNQDFLSTIMDLTGGMKGTNYADGCKTYSTESRRGGFDRMWIEPFHSNRSVKDMRILKQEKTSAK